MAEVKSGPVVASRLVNFRRFEDTGWINWAPVTLVLGKNSSGKTSLLRSMLLVRQFLDAATFEDVPLAGSSVDFGSFREVVFGGELSRDVRVEVELAFSGAFFEDYPETFVRPAFRALSNGTRLSMLLHWNKKLGKPQFSAIEFSPLGGGASVVRFARLGPRSFQVDIGSSRSKVAATLNFGSLRRFDLLPADSKQPSGGRRAAQPDYSMVILLEAMSQAIQSVRHVGPLRDMPDRAYRLDQLSPESPTASVVNVLERQRQAQAAMSQALRQLGMARDVSLKRLAPGYVGIVLSDPDTGRSDNLSDVGFGVSQVLPVLATIATASCTDQARWLSACDEIV